MKHLSLALVGLGAAAVLAACGGGSSTPPTQQTPTPTTYTAKLVFTGPLAGVGAKAAIARRIGFTYRTMAVPESSGSTSPVMVVSPIEADGTMDGIQANVFGGLVQAVASPATTATPQTTFSNTNNAVALATVAPTALPSAVVAEENATTSGAVNAQVAGTVTANIGSPVNQSPTTPTYAYQAISVSCENPLPPGSSPGWAYVSGAWTTVSSPSAADVYLTGPDCPGAFNATTPDATFEVLNFPGGGGTLSTDTSFYSIVASSCAFTTTSADMETMDTLNADGSQNTEVCAKTRAGTFTFKLFPNSFGPKPGDISGAIEISGPSSIDGF